jgi:hypothetical protein
MAGARRAILPAQVVFMVSGLTVLQEGREVRLNSKVGFSRIWSDSVVSPVWAWLVGPARSSLRAPPAAVTQPASHSWFSIAHPTCAPTLEEL